MKGAVVSMMSDNFVKDLLATGASSCSRHRKHRSREAGQHFGLQKSNSGSRSRKHLFRAMEAFDEPFFEGEQEAELVEDSWIWGEKLKQLAHKTHKKSHKKSHRKDESPHLPPRVLIQHTAPKLDTEEHINANMEDELIKYNDSASPLATIVEAETVANEPSKTKNSASSGGSNSLGTSSSLCTTETGAMTTNSSSSRSSSGAPSGNQGLVVGYYLFDEKVPYRSLWTGTRPITLRDFKMLIPKRGNLRFFFKNASNEFDELGAVMQEVTAEDQELPLYEGKVVAKVERVD
ncbi:Axin-2 [Cichlidogyrus casuarinus]|uniref:Axin-2 n=1 Tax=Cichlidogyrus casuarinus TaxID=1844966 RepID=A0ABD2PSQ6_9PLAT